MPNRTQNLDRVLLYIIRLRFFTAIPTIYFEIVSEENWKYLVLIFCNFVRILLENNLFHLSSITLVWSLTLLNCILIHLEWLNLCRLYLQLMKIHHLILRKTQKFWFLVYISLFMQVAVSTHRVFFRCELKTSS